MQAQQTNDQGNIVQTIIAQLDPFIKTTINDALGSQFGGSQTTGSQFGGSQATGSQFGGSQTTTVLDQNTQDEAIVGVMSKLRPIIKRVVLSVMNRLQSAGTLNSLSDARIIAEVNNEIDNGQLMRLLEEEIASLIGPSKPLPARDTLQDLLKIMLPQIRQIIIREIALWRQTANPQLSSSQSQRIVSRILNQLRGRAESATNQYLEGSSSSVSNNVVVENVIAQFQPQIISAIEGDATIQQTFSSGSFVGSDAFKDLFGEIILSLRGIILRQIKAWRATQVVVQPVPVAPVAPAGGSAITNIFGTGGANSVQVETPSFSYEYNHARSFEARSLE